MVHPVSHASFVVRLEAFCCQIQPYRRQSVAPNWIRCTFEPYQRPSKERVTTPKGMHLPVEHRHVASDSGLSLEQSWNKGSFQKVPNPCTAAARSKKSWSQNSGPLFNRETTDGETRKMANCSTLLRCITRLKIVNSDTGRRFPFPT